MLHVSSGDLLRAQMRDGTELGLAAKSYIDKGDLVPDSVMVGLISSELKKLGEKPWLLDGFPRTQAQAEALQKETPVNVVVNLCVPFETIIERVKDRWIHPGSGRVYNLVFNPPKVAGKDDESGEDLVQRDDDKPESVRNRLEVFQQNTEPVLEFYRKMGICQVGAFEHESCLSNKNILVSNLLVFGLVNAVSVLCEILFAGFPWN